MSKIITGAVILMMLTTIGCDRLDMPDGTPPCITRMAKTLRGEAVRNPPAMIIEFTLKNGGKYYYVPPYCCDMFSALYDSECNYVCAPDGGFSGQGDGHCPDNILNNIQSSKVIWKDDRGND